MRLLKLLSALYLIIGIARSSSVSSDYDGEFEPRAPLGEKEFRQELKSGLHLVEFYSPYCPHCRDFAPTWHETWRKFRKEGERLNISFVQVNCVKDGDLCYDEAITEYPAIKLYGPEGFIKNYPNEYERTEGDLINFARQEALDPINMEATDLEISSKFLNAQDFNELLAGKGKQPYLVSFWPSDDHEDPLAGSKSYDFCPECQTFQKLWPQITKKLLLQGVATGHINCETLPNLCHEMEFHKLVNGAQAVDNYPRVALVLPGKGVNNLFIYENGFSSSVWSYEDFAVRAISNSEAPEITLEQIVELVRQDFQFPESKNLPVPSQALHVVFAYSPENVVTEDFHVLEHLVKHLAKVPNAYLHKSKDDVSTAAKVSLDYMYEKINYNRSEPVKLPKTDYLELNLVPQSPTFYIFKEGDWVPHLYVGDSTTETRNVEALAKWFNESALPVISEVTPYNFGQLLSFQPSDYDAVAIQLVDLTDAESIKTSNEQLKNFIKAAYDYEDVRMQNVVNVRAEKRANKNKRIKELKAAKASSDKIGKVYHEEIKFEDKNKVILGYVDISKGPHVLEDLGFHRGRDDYKSGDVLVVDSYSSAFTEKDVFGNRLTTDSMYALRETLVKLILPELSHFHERLESQELSFNYSRGLDIFEPMRKHKVWRYFFIVGALVLIVKAPSFYKKFKSNKKYKAKRSTVGILGQPSKRSKD
ncbi:hypothetical protein ZYGR_0N03900 [Zygosaccharomyces rouxii]|uniref:ZYRO0D09240p n=2 Tax=Zygosaccharomyces rouxii TaxID=4956 RepID=C5DVT4_ZYGRC|nr:uncharacterized protein ZYRO0D09240g [Zygosaccharomyces rouxii]KAH9200814.1 hypothetical protein LQ764DRAFT_99464 [Zygosaccharomyces rouxii]GAV48985.1 hypothetical protein ZYGR_0N03900 [Zygosaccharomyces rouxii]CAR27903.1 ZYRO0D09240p [Zygosaccharomyces rouxii]